MRALRQRLATLRQKYPAIAKRKTWVWLAPAMCLAWAVFVPGVRLSLFAAWACINLFYALAACAWACFHPRAVLAARDTGLRWAIYLGLLLSVVGFAFSYDSFLPASLAPALSGNASSLAFLLFLLALLFLTLALMGLGLLGAFIGAFAVRHRRDRAETERSARAGVAGWMLTFLPLAALARGNSPYPPFFWLISAVLLTAGYCRLTLGGGTSIMLRLTKARKAVGQRLLWERRTRQGLWRLDLRGAVMGLSVAAVLLCLPPALFGRVQALGLNLMLRMRSALSVITVSNGEDDRAALRARQKIVVLEMDAPARYLVATHSEAYLQAQILRRLQADGAAGIVLPAPALRERDLSARQRRTIFLASPSSDRPPPGKEDVAANRRDRRLLADAMRQCGNVLFMTSAAQDDDTDPVLAALEAAAVNTGGDARTEAPATHLPLIPAHWLHSAPVAVETARVLKEGLAAAAGSRQRADGGHLDTGMTPKVYPDGIVVDFMGQGPRRDFPHLEYSALLREDAVPAAASRAKKGGASTSKPDSQADAPRIYGALAGEEPGQARWLTPQEFFKGRIVLLDSLAHPLQASPLGPLSQSEMLAYAAATLQTGESFTKAPQSTFVLLTLLIGLLAGCACYRQEPLDAAWRVAIPLFCVLLGAIMALFGGVWFDPIVPLLVIVATLRIATHVTFSQERAERQKTRDLFGRFVAPHMVDGWLQQREGTLGLGGKREKVCVLFADVRNFTAFAEQHDAIEVIDIINVYMTALTDALSFHGGILDKYTGDGLMAFFEVGEPPVNDVRRAALAALDMRAAAAELSERRRAEGKPTLEIGIGLHYGEAVVGLVGNAKRQINYTALGHTVVVSARLQTIALGGEVVISEDVYREVAGQFTCEADEPVQVKGMSALVRPYRVIGVNDE